MFDKLKKGFSDITTEAQNRVNVAKDAKAMLDNATTAEKVQAKKACEDAVEADKKAEKAMETALKMYDAACEKMFKADADQEFVPLRDSFKERSAKLKEIHAMFGKTSGPPPMPAISLSERDAIQVLRAKEAVGFQHRPSTAGSTAPIVVAEATVDTNGDKPAA
mmetsp:Transcript_22834/g.53387  ORF Transcript_22834/g.53387 Transcript_22834/m.53387 type:complete len:164 (-) Transcript_22834:240-731(-)|eukprot:CAMPEP_0178417906 /NCGR_PEP_ID=MMETSP0689_2-20121128/24814_1 /TAXON_ID=160604 /ORGANISM="Amphidinium massartii, Strain CS-259" /LENGTH=163 /DNA_ID=CAMNT_0020039283 /DNA_START=98 /DNA_END=589 /DNA_ORIENTATION=-